MNRRRFLVTTAGLVALSQVRDLTFPLKAEAVGASWAARVGQTGVIMSHQMSSSADIDPYLSLTNWLSPPQYDATENAMRFEFPYDAPNLSAAGGIWHNSPAYADQPDASQDFYVQFLIKDNEWVTEASNKKMFDFGAGDRATYPPESTGGLPVLILTTRDLVNTVIPYTYNGSGLVSLGTDVSGGNVWFQQGVPSATYFRVSFGEHGAGYRIAANGYQAITMYVQLGPRVGDDFVNSKLWIAMGWAGHPSRAIIMKEYTQFAQQIPQQGGGNPAPRLGKLHLFPYRQDLASGTVPGYRWYKEVLIGKGPIAGGSAPLDPFGDGPILFPTIPTASAYNASATADGRKYPETLAMPNPGANTWVQVTPKPSSRWLDGGDFTVAATMSGQAYPVGRSYGGWHYGAGKLMNFGGSHASYPANDVEMFAIAHLMWAQMQKPNVLPRDTFSYTGLTGTSFTGVTGVAGPSSGAAVWPSGAGVAKPGETLHTTTTTGTVAVGAGTINVVSTAGFAASGTAQIQYGSFGGNSNFGASSDSDTDADPDRPWVEHTSAVISWYPARNAFLALLVNGTWEFNPGTNRWTRVGDGPGGGAWTAAAGSLGVNRWATFYDPVTSLMHAYVSSGGQVGVWTWGGSSWSLKNATIPGGTGMCYSAYMASVQRHFVWLWNDLYYSYNPAGSGSFGTLLTGVPTNIASFDWDSVNNRLVGIRYVNEGAISLYTYNPSTDTWAQQTNPATVPDTTLMGVTDLQGQAPVLKYDPVNNLFWLLLQNGGSAGAGGSNTQTWVYRLAAAVGGGGGRSRMRIRI